MSFREVNDLAEQAARDEAMEARDADLPEPQGYRTSGPYVVDAACPECAAGNHHNCDGGAWDTEFDHAGACPCWHAGHQPKGGAA